MDTNRMLPICVLCFYLVRFFFCHISSCSFGLIKNVSLQLKTPAFEFKIFPSSSVVTSTLARTSGLGPGRRQRGSEVQQQYYRWHKQSTCELPGSFMFLAARIGGAHFCLFQPNDLRTKQVLRHVELLLFGGIAYVIFIVCCHVEVVGRNRPWIRMQYGKATAGSEKHLYNWKTSVMSRSFRISLPFKAVLPVGGCSVGGVRVYTHFEEGVDT